MVRRRGGRDARARSGGSRHGNSRRRAVSSHGVASLARRRRPLAGTRTTSPKGRRVARESAGRAALVLRGVGPPDPHRGTGRKDEPRRVRRVLRRATPGESTGRSRVSPESGAWPIGASSRPSSRRPRRSSPGRRCRARSIGADTGFSRHVLSSGSTATVDFTTGSRTCPRAIRGCGSACRPKSLVGAADAAAEVSEVCSPPRSSVGTRGLRLLNWQSQVSSANCSGGKK